MNETAGPVEYVEYADHPASEAVHYLRELLVGLARESGVELEDDSIDTIGCCTMGLVAEMFIEDHEFMYWAMTKAGAVHEEKAAAREVIAHMREIIEKAESS